MHQPPGFATAGENLVCLLRKSIYGLKQSPRAWFDKFSKVIETIGFTRSSSDSSLFTHHSAQGYVVLLVYVDDIIVTGDNLAGISKVKAHLASQFHIKDLGPLRYFLGIEIVRKGPSISLSQRKYTLDLLKETGLLGCKPAETPMDSSTHLSRETSAHDQPLEDPGMYRRLVGKLIYLTVTRPDITFAVSVVSQHMQTPLQSHLQAVRRILLYLKKAPGQGLVYRSSSTPPSLVAFADADFAGSVDDRRSTSGYCTFFAGNLITWRSKKQTVVARSTAEAEYRAMAHTVAELRWLQYLLKDLGVSLASPPTLFCDNKAAIAIAENPVFHERTKHIEVDCHFIRSHVLHKEITLLHVSSDGQIADIFTKPLPRPLFWKFLDKLGMRDLYAPACGGVLPEI